VASREHVGVLPGRAARVNARGEFDGARFLWVFGGVVLAFMLLPVFVVILFSLNSNASLVRFAGFSFRWYREALSSGDWHASLRASFEIAAVTTCVCAVVGTLFALGLARGSRHVAAASDGGILLRLVTPETATGVASLLLFTKLGLTLSQN